MKQFKAIISVSFHLQKSLLLVSSLLLIALSCSQTSNQKDGDIDGESVWDESGESVHMPEDLGNAVGSWVQKGGDIDGEAKYDESGYSVNMPDANTVAIGVPKNADNGEESGHVRVYKWNGNAWVLKGQDIDGEAPGG